uniref:SWIM-type domain-containing protein n=1 Tax=Phytophthora fragariae TaxID=53985 RepID=A0A6A3FAF8_9STRA|nr:hypothetical protein PF009_g8014 [Phytophthora fragariae]
MESAAESDGIPPAQGSVNSKTSQHEKDDDSDGKPSQEEEASSSSDSQSSSSSESANESCEFASGTSVMKDVELMVASGSWSSRIYHYIRENSPHRVEMRDVYNLVAKIKKSGNKLTDEDQVAELLVKFNMRADGNVARIDENSRCQTAVVSLSSEHMRKLVHRVDKFDWMCSCEFSATMNLPCRHAMMYRKHTAGLMAIPYASIPSRWLRVGTLEEELPEVDVPLCITTQGDEVKRKKQMTEQDKYKSVQSVFGRITTELMDLPDGKFSDALEQLEQWVLAQVQYLLMSRLLYQNQQVIGRKVLQKKPQKQPQSQV